MKKMFSKSWFQVLVMGLAVGIILIIADAKFNLFSGAKEKTDYEGPITIEKDKAYFTKAKLDATEFDFGKVNEGDTLTHTFTLTNTGEEPLAIYKSKGSCDCVAALFSKELILPDSSVKVITYFDTKGRKGEQKRVIELTCNTEPAQINITLKADIQ